MHLIQKSILYRLEFPSFLFKQTIYIDGSFRSMMLFLQLTEQIDFPDEINRRQ